MLKDSRLGKAQSGSTKRIKDSFLEKKSALIKYLIEEGYLKTQSVIDAFRKVKREDFVTDEMKKYAYVNEPLPIGEGQTISQPLTVAFMTEHLAVERGQKILEIGAGSGYQAAILSEIVGQRGRIITTEIIPKLALFAENNLTKYKNVKVVCCDGSLGYENEAPYDRIIVTAASPNVPAPLINQLKDNGKMIIPIGDEMYLIEKHEKETRETMLGYFAFVPLVGEKGYKI
jgi:protein-L-isoaspartate(D-aspartate) O-methyltransferase